MSLKERYGPWALAGRGMRKASASIWRASSPADGINDRDDVASQNRRGVGGASPAQSLANGRSDPPDQQGPGAVAFLE